MVLKWLKENTSHSFNIEAEYNYECSKQYPNGSVKIFLDLDEPSINKLEKYLNPNKTKGKSQKECRRSKDGDDIHIISTF